MTKIEFVCFGGQDEKDKVCDALIIDEDIYILGCGISCPSTITLGIKKIIPDFNENIYINFNYLLYYLNYKLRYCITIFIKTNS